MTKHDIPQIIKLYTQEKKSQMQISKIFNVSQMTISSILNKNNIKCRSIRKYFYDENMFNILNDNSEKELHFIGFFIADGTHNEKTKRLTITIHQKDIDILQKYNKLIYKDAFNIRLIQHKSKNKKIFYGATFDIFGKTLSSRFSELGIHSNKSFTATIPDIEFSEKMFKFFLKGLFDGDGHFSFKHVNSTVAANIDIACSEKMCSQLITYLKQYGFNGKQRIHKSGIYYLRLCGIFNCFSFLNWLYDESTIHLNRKYNTYLEFCTFMKTYVSRQFGNRKKKVGMYNDNNIMLQTFDKLKNAAFFINCDAQSLSKKIKKNQKYKGYFWKFI